MLRHTIDELIENFALFDDWEERYRYLIDLGKELEPMPEALKTDDTIVPGCTSKVWMTAEEKDGKYFFLADSDAHIVRGLIAVLLSAYQGRSASEIQNVDIKEKFQAMGLNEHLSPNRRNGFFAMVERIHLLAQA